MDYLNATKEEEAAFKKVISAIQAAKKLGLTFYGKSGSLVVYTKRAEKYQSVNGGFDRLLRGTGGQLPNLSAEILNDSGADDFARFISDADQKKYDARF